MTRPTIKLQLDKQSYIIEKERTQIEYALFYYRLF